MWGFDTFGLPTSLDGALTVPVWAAGIALALVLVFFVLALIRSGTAGTLMFLGLLAFGVWGGWRWMDNDRVTERRALEQRLLALDLPTFAPGSPLACLDAGSAEPMGPACERTLFQSPESVNAASVLTTHRVAALSEASAVAARQDATFDHALDDLRSRLEHDRYGLVAYVLAGKGCTPERCEQFRLLRDPARVRSNMRERTFETILARHAPNWPDRSNVAATGSGNAAAAPAAAFTPGMVATPVAPRYTLPSATSIPPVSIMANEPAPTAAAAPPAEAAAPAPQPRRPVVQRPPARTQTTNTGPIPPPPPRPQ